MNLILFNFNLFRDRPQSASFSFSLDISKVKHDLMNLNEKHQILLLQALRWRLTKAENPEQRHRSLSAYIAGDLLGCRNPNSRGNVIDLINSNNETIKQYTARLVNAIASLNHGKIKIQNVCFWTTLDF